MKAKVVLKFGGKTRLRLEDGRVLELNQEQLRHFNPAVKQGDTGTLYNDPRTGALKFKIDYTDVELTDPAEQDTINSIQHTGT